MPYSIPLFYGKASTEKYPFPFIGYTYVPGRYPAGLTSEVRSLSAAELARILRKLHTYPVKEAQENGVLYDTRNVLDIGLRKEKMLRFLKVLSHILRRMII